MTTRGKAKTTTGIAVCETGFTSAALAGRVVRKGEHFRADDQIVLDHVTYFVELGTPERSEYQIGIETLRAAQAREEAAERRAPWSKAPSE